MNSLHWDFFKCMEEIPKTDDWKKSAHFHTIASAWYDFSVLQMPSKLLRKPLRISCYQCCLLRDVFECSDVLSDIQGTQDFSTRATVVLQLLILCLSGEE